jgi:hypothetical protein
MDRRRAALIALGMLAALGPLGACGGGAGGRVVARGTLAYGAAWHGDDLVTVELAERFELVIRRGAALRVVRRVALGPPELDLGALAVAGSIALVGGDDGWIRRIDLGPGLDAGLDAEPDAGDELERWPAGAPITAIAATADYVAIADATGAICVRRASGELLQCAALARADAGAELAIDPDEPAVIWSAPGAAARRYSLPALRPLPSGAIPPRRWGDGELTVDPAAGIVTWTHHGAARRLARLGGRVRSIATSRTGRLAIAGWVRALDQPSVIVWIAPPR